MLKLLLRPGEALIPKVKLRVIKTLQDLKEFFGSDRRISLSREISKIYEETYRGTIEDAIAHLSNKNPKGEFVICIDKLG